MAGKNNNNNNRNFDTQHLTETVTMARVAVNKYINDAKVKAHYTWCPYWKWTKPVFRREEASLLNPVK